MTGVQNVLKGRWPLTWICRRKGHRLGRWYSSFQPHVAQQACQRCGALWTCLKTCEDPSCRICHDKEGTPYAS